MGDGRVGGEADTLGVRRERPERRGEARDRSAPARAGAPMDGGGEGGVACRRGGYMWLPVPRDVDGGLLVT